MLPKWEERFSLHNELIDTQHKKLFALAQDVYDLPEHSTKAQIRTLFVDFFDYMATHFKDEEAYMQSIGYPQIHKHKAKHKAIIKEMTRILRTSPNIEKIRISLLEEVQDWLVNHILIEDLEIEKWHREHKKPNNEELINLDSMK